MSDLDRNALDRWITGGRYSEQLVDVTCSECKEVTTVKSMTEYGMTDWDPGECASCKRGFDGEEAWVEFEPPEPEPPERWDDEDRWEPLP